jgi:hypothetical protein
MRVHPFQTTRVFCRQAFTPSSRASAVAADARRLLQVSAGQRTSADAPATRAAVGTMAFTYKNTIAMCVEDPLAPALAAAGQSAPRWPVVVGASVAALAALAALLAAVAVALWRRRRRRGADDAEAAKSAPLDPPMQARAFCGGAACVDSAERIGRGSAASAAKEDVLQMRPSRASLDGSPRVSGGAAALLPAELWRQRWLGGGADEQARPARCRSPSSRGAAKLRL